MVTSVASEDGELLAQFVVPGGDHSFQQPHHRWHLQRLSSCGEDIPSGFILGRPPSGLLSFAHMEKHVGKTTPLM